jgi:hypothetical protein
MRRSLSTNLVRPAGFEPATNGLGNRCSIRAELRAHKRPEVCHSIRPNQRVSKNTQIPMYESIASGLGDSDELQLASIGHDKGFIRPGNG